jgi:hypothetical protein
MPNGNGNGSGSTGEVTIRRWQVFLALAVVLLSIGGTVFKAGLADAAFEIRLTKVESDLVQIRAEYARKDVIEQRLAEIERSTARVERLENEQSDKLDRILLQQQRRGHID